MTPSVLHLLGPKFRTRVNRARGDRGRLAKWTILGVVGVAFWLMLFAVIYRMLIHFRGAQGIGDVLAAKLLGLAFLTFFMILLLSNVIASLSTFFLSKDLDLLASAPVDPVRFYGARLGETIVDSSWMVALLSVPILAAYGVMYGGGVAFPVVAVATMLPFLVIPAVVGTLSTLVLVNVFPARRTRDLLALIGLFSAAGVVVLLRVLRPERLMRPDEFRSLVDFVAVLRTPTSAWLPNEWVADSLMGYLGGRFDFLPLLLLWTTAAAFFVFGAWLHQGYYATGFTRAQEGAELRAGRIRSSRLDRLLGRASPRSRALLGKEVRVFFRDATQWSQLILLGVLVAVYVYNIRVLPLHTGEEVSFLLQNAVSFLNLGLAGFVVAAIAARFVFPAISVEGRMLWLLRSSPSSVKSLFWAKYWVGVVPLLAVALPLTVGTNAILKASPFLMVLSVVTMIGITFGLASLALGFGAFFPNFETENAAEIPTSYGGLLFMMAAVVYLGLVVSLEGWPVYLYLSRGLEGAARAPVWPLVLGLSGAAALTMVAIVAPLRLGVRRVEALSHD
ncbi:MAG: hypothetical protein OEO23_03215 [Gemmatimonadota bacterium]|nr:hypothetical protein [Gemmatimonadota bacterium]